ncbi:MAG: STAS domain-containing protein [Clostridiales bacterium]|jgi:anti-anti-sigma factor|nr:STAS domain-containing protein [Clostridiales bacterium]
MTISLEQTSLSLLNGPSLLIRLNGRLDSKTAPRLEEAFAGVPKFAELTLELSELDYISSAGLRVLLIMHKGARGLGARMKLRGVGEAVMEVLEAAGFTEYLDVKRFKAAPRRGAG